MSVITNNTASELLNNKLLSAGNSNWADATDNTKLYGVQLSGATTGTKATLVLNQGANISLTLPPTTDTLVGRATADNLTNKTLTNASNFFVDGTDTTKKVGFVSSAATTGITLTLGSQQTTNQTINFPNVTSGDTAVTLAAAQTLTNKTLTSNTNSVTSKGLFSASTTIDVSAATAPTVGQVLTALGGTSASWQAPSMSANIDDLLDYVYNDTDNTKRQNWNLSGATTGTQSTLAFVQTANQVITFPNVTDTLVGLAATQTLTNKTLTAPTITGAGTISAGSLTANLLAIAIAPSSTTTIAALTREAGGLVTVNTTLVSATGPITLTNKTVDSASNTLTVTNAPLAAANVNTLLNQALLTTSNVTFGNVTTTGTSTSFCNAYCVINTGTASVTSAVPVTIITLPIGSGAAAKIEATAVVYNSTDSTSGVFELTARITNPSGTAAIGGYLKNLSNPDPTGFSGAALTFTASSGNILIKYAGVASKTHSVKVTAFVYAN